MTRWCFKCSAIVEIATSLGDLCPGCGSNLAANSPLGDPELLPSEILVVIPREFALEHSLVPLAVHDDTLLVMMADPSNTVAIKEVKRLVGLDVAVLMESDATIAKAIAGRYPQN